MFLKLTIKTPEWPDVFINNFKQNLHLCLVFLFLNWTRKWLVDLASLISVMSITEFA